MATVIEVIAKSVAMNHNKTIKIAMRQSYLKAGGTP